MKARQSFSILLPLNAHFILSIATIHFCNSSYAVFPYAIVFIFNLHGSAHSFLMSGDVDV